MRLLLLAGSVVIGGTTAPAPDLVELLERARPAVVLIVAETPGTHARIGTAFVLEGGLVLTALHVVADAPNIGALLYEEGRTTYAAMDGGVARFWFEHRGDAVPARLIRGDPLHDLALLELQADIDQVPALKPAASAVKPGERVVALGHPHENLWSFTAGLVGSTPMGLIQHGAPVNPGSSGGPLLNLDGHVVGVNVGKLGEQAEGIAFARPIDAAMELVRGETESIDLRTIESAFRTCVRAIEAAAAVAVDCYDWDSRYDIYRSERRPLLDRNSWVVAEQAMLSRELRGTTDEDLADAILRIYPRRVSPLERPRSKADEQFARELRDLLDSADQPRQRPPSAVKMLQGTIKLGLRLEEVHHVSERQAWGRVSGRQPDGKTVQFSILWVRKGNGSWLQQTPPPARAMPTLPKGWPTAMEDRDGFLSSTRPAPTP